ncbi:hypothetical protein KW797_01375 [Candidatus Parcubacteria bacterium]|nr:hypothetical protein [Candidatus Parcubacteria bacterium]
MSDADTSTKTLTPPNPLGSCFDAAAHNLAMNLDEESLVMCHGLGVATWPGQEGKRIAHAWLEFDHEGKRAALDCIWMVAQPADFYRNNLKADYVVEYTKDEFMRLWHEHNFPGPWDELLKKFTKDNDPL